MSCNFSQKIFFFKVSAKPILNYYKNYSLNVFFIVVKINVNRILKVIDIV